MEKMNHTLKNTIRTLCQETPLTWDRELLLALLHIRVAPQSGLRWSPCGTLYGRSFPASTHIGRETKIKQYVQHVNQNINQHSSVCFLYDGLFSGRTTAPISIWGQGLIKNLERPDQELIEKWIGPYDVLWTTHSSLKLGKVKLWIHHTRVKSVHR